MKLICHCDETFDLRLVREPGGGYAGCGPAATVLPAELPPT